MGNENSTPAGGETYGFRVLGIQENSPSSDAGFVSFFDFIVEANGVRLDEKNATFMELITGSEEKDLDLSVYNSKSKKIRKIRIVPSSNWNGKGLLGVTIRFDTFKEAEDQALHVVDVVKNSPAEKAGLIAETDYLLGSPECVFTDPDQFFDLILDSINGSLQSYVYNSKTDQVRIVTISPNDNWGGEGFLGAEIAHGYIHRIPEHCRNSTGTSVGYVKVPTTSVIDTYKYSPSYEEEADVEGKEDEEDEEDEEDKTMDALKANLARQSLHAEESKSLDVSAHANNEASQNEKEHQIIGNVPHRMIQSAGLSGNTLPVSTVKTFIRSPTK